MRRKWHLQMYQEGQRAYVGRQNQDTKAKYKVIGWKSKDKVFESLFWQIHQELGGLGFCFF